MTRTRYLMTNSNLNNIYKSSTTEGTRKKLQPKEINYTQENTGNNLTSTKPKEGKPHTHK